MLVWKEKSYTHVDITRYNYLHLCKYYFTYNGETPIHLAGHSYFKKKKH